MIGKNPKILSLLLLLFSINVMATVTASVDRNQIVVGETFTLNITVDENTSDQPDLSVLEQVFRVLGTSQSSSTQIINGQYSVKKSWQVSLMPLAVGKNTIPPIKLGNKYTKAINIVVTKSDPNAKADGDLFIEITSDKTTAFVKEQIILTVKLFYAISLSEGNLTEPVASNTIVTQLDKGTTYTTNRNGQNYTVVERHYAIFAEKSGKLEMNPVIFNGRDNTSRRSFSMFSTGKPVRAVSKALSFEIKPIPQQSIGKDWLPATQVKLSQEWSKGPYKEGEPITRTITLYVEGLHDTQIPEIDLGEIKDVRVYPEQPQTQTEKTAQTIKAWKQIKIALIPTHKGSIRIPEYQLEWYNTKKHKIEKAKLPPVTLKVQAGEFSVQKPNITELLNQDNKNKNSKVSAKPEIKYIEKSNGAWKVLTLIFASLWLFTAAYFLLNKPKKPQMNKPEKQVSVSKKQLLAAIQNKDLFTIQSDLITWWNQQYSQNVTNLSQIKSLVNPQMQSLIENLQAQLYDSNKLGDFNQEAWVKQVNGNGLKLINVKKQTQSDELPELYS